LGSASTAAPNFHPSSVDARIAAWWVTKILKNFSLTPPIHLARIHRNPKLASHPHQAHLEGKSISNQIDKINRKG
jgi:hypothetical protein